MSSRLPMDLSRRYMWLWVIIGMIFAAALISLIFLFINKCISRSGKHRISKLHRGSDFAVNSNKYQETKAIIPPLPPRTQFLTGEAQSYENLAEVPDYVQSVPDYKEDEHDYEESVPDYVQSVPDYEQDKHDYEESVPDYVQSVPDYEQDKNDYEESTPDYKQDDHDYEESTADYVQSVPDYEQDKHNYEENLDDYVKVEDKAGSSLHLSYKDPDPTSDDTSNEDYDDVGGEDETQDEDYDDVA